MTVLPAGWRWSTLGQVADVVGGVTKDSKRDGRPDLVEVPYLRVANVQRGRIDLTQVLTIRVPAQTAAKLELTSPIQTGCPIIDGDRRRVHLTCEDVIA